MSKLILNIYDLFRRRRWLCRSIFAALTAVVVLFYVSNWMVSKSESATWSSYI